MLQLNREHAAKDMPFRSSFKPGELEKFSQRCHFFRKRIYTPEVTLCAFLSQVTSKGSSCQQAVTEVLAHQIGNKSNICSSKTSSYTRARAKIPLEAIKELTKQVAKDIESDAPEDWKFKGRNVFLLDGSTASVTDTKANAEMFRPRRNQGTSYPLARMSAMTSVATGALIDFEIASWVGTGSGEFFLARKLLKSLNGGEIIVGDAFYLSHFFIHCIKENNADFVTVVKGNRSYTVTNSKKLDHNDRLILVRKPRIPRTGWVSQETYDNTPNELLLRETIFVIKKNGFREKEIKIISTLLNHEEYTAEDVAALYRLRWNIELDFRTIKKSIGLEFLKCKTPDMVMKEAWIYLLAYNLLRRVVKDSALASNQKPRQISMIGALFALSCFKYSLATSDRVSRQHIYQSMLQTVAQQRVGNRPERFEPRAVRRRICINDYDRLRISRSLWKVMTLLPHLNLEASGLFKGVLDRIREQMPLSAAVKNKRNYAKRKDARIYV